MKKLFIALCFMLGASGLATAQTGKKAAPAATTQTAKPSAAEILKGQGARKADGTLDKRFKKNKGLKKDGTLDMRYSDNKKKKA